MSGGSYDYAHEKIEGWANQVERSAERGREGWDHAPDSGPAPAPLRRAFAQHLRDVAKAMYAIEWNDSGDGVSDEVERIQECLREGLEIEVAAKRAKQAVLEMRDAVERLLSSTL